MRFYNILFVKGLKEPPLAENILFVKQLKERRKYIIS